MRLSFPMVFLQLFGVQTLAAEPSHRPNIILILVDDMGYGDAGCYGGTAFPTPNIDRLAAEGMKFTDFHSSGCVCSPTRAGLLTGRYQQRAGIPGVVYAAFGKNRHHGLQHQEVTFAEILRDAGYRTAMFGKWHLGYEEQYNPVHQGFEKYIGYVSGNVDFHTHIDGAGVADWWHQNKRQPEEGYTTHLITKHTCRFIEQTAAEGKPFCVYVAHEAPHDPYQGPDDPPVRREGDSKLLYDHRAPDHAERAYAQMMTEMDKGLGDILETVRKTGIDNRTLVMFFSDNGATGPGSCGPLYGMKGTLWEGGHRVPGLARWPGRIPAGTVCSQLATTLDVLPTLLEIAEIQTPSELQLDGVSLARTLLSGRPNFSRQVFWQYGNATAMRDGHWKLIVNGGKRIKRSPTLIPRINWEHPKDNRDKVALFDLSNDIAEQHNLATKEPGRVRKMQGQLRRWLEEVTARATRQPDRGQD